MELLNLVRTALYFAILAFVILMLARLVLEWVQYFARDWRPTGVMLVIAEVTYSITDPPIRAVRTLVPPLTIGSFRLDLAFLIVMVLCWVAMTVLTLL